jgi:hypothetical protein
MSAIDINHAIMAILFYTTAYIKLRGNQMEHFWIRLVAALWYTLTLLVRDMPVEFVRVISTNIIIIVLSIEILSPIIRKYRLFK